MFFSCFYDLSQHSFLNYGIHISFIKQLELNSLKYYAIVGSIKLTVSDPENEKKA